MVEHPTEHAMPETGLRNKRRNHEHVHRVDAPGLRDARKFHCEHVCNSGVHCKRIRLREAAVSWWCHCATAAASVLLRALSAHGIPRAQFDVTKLKRMLFPCYRKRHWFFGVVDSNLKKVWLEDSYLAATGARAHMEFMKVCCWICVGMLPEPW